VRGEVRLLMPRLGEPVEPTHELPLDPWWRTVDAGAPDPDAMPPVPAEPITESGPQRQIPWPLD
jgi:hypothetical protein